MEDIFDEMNLLVYSGLVDIRMEKETTPESFAESKELLEDIEKQKSCRKILKSSTRCFNFLYFNRVSITLCIYT